MICGFGEKAEVCGSGTPPGLPSVSECLVRMAIRVRGRRKVGVRVGVGKKVGVGVREKVGVRVRVRV